MSDQTKKDAERGKRIPKWSIAGWSCLALAFLTAVCVNYSGDSPILQFAQTAAPWVLLGLALIFLVLRPRTAGEKKESEEEP